MTRTVRPSMVVALLVFSPLSAFAQGPPEFGSTRVERQLATAALDYWTPERLNSAVPMDLLEADEKSQPEQFAAPADAGSEGFTPAGTRGAFGGAAPMTRPAADPMAFFQQFYAYPAPFTRHDVPQVLYDESLGYVQYPYTTIGKLFFTIPGQGNFVCSASVVRPHLVLTARHCVFNGNWFTNVVFFPAYHNGPNFALSPWYAGGGWPARILATWVSPCCGLGALDIGFIQTFDDDGTGCGGSDGGFPIEAYTGWLGTMWAGNAGNQPVRHYNEMGYPQGAPFSGRWMVQSASSTAVFDFNGINDTIGVGNDLTGGSSGGPWIVGLDPGSTPGGSPGGNFVNGLNSYKWIVPARPLEMNGPQFKDYNFNQLRLFAEGIACP